MVPRCGSTSPAVKPVKSEKRRFMKSVDPSGRVGKSHHRHRLDHITKLFFASAESLFRLLDLMVKTAILERDRRLRGEHFQNLQSRRRKDVGNKFVFEV